MNPEFQYTPAAQMGDGYLQRKWDRQYQGWNTRSRRENVEVCLKSETRPRPVPLKESAHD